MLSSGLLYITTIYNFGKSRIPNFEMRSNPDWASSDPLLRVPFHSCDDGIAEYSRSAGTALPVYRPYKVVFSSERVERLFQKVLEKIPADS